MFDPVCIPGLRSYNLLHLVVRVETVLWLLTLVNLFGTTRTANNGKVMLLLNLVRLVRTRKRFENVFMVFYIFYIFYDMAVTVCCYARCSPLAASAGNGDSWVKRRLIVQPLHVYKYTLPWLWDLGYPWIIMNSIT